MDETLDQPRGGERVRPPAGPSRRQDGATLHIRVIAPTATCAVAREFLIDHPGVTHLWIGAGVSVKPAGDVFSFDVAREAAGGVLASLRALGIERDGAVVIEQLDVVVSDAADAAEDAAPGSGTDALVWEEMEAAAGEETKLSATYLAFMTVASIIASIGVLLDQPILIVGAMVVGPEFGPLVALCVGAVTGHRAAAARAVGTLVVGFAVAMVATVLSTWLLTLSGLVDKDMLLAPRPLTSFIWQPDALSWVVGFLAGVAGMLSLTSRKSGALVGVLISVTTIPAAANAAVAVAYGESREAWGSTVQLVVNLASIVVAGMATLLVQRAHQRRLDARAARTRAAR